MYPCGQCTACRLNKVRDWTMRLMHEAKFHDKMVFLTITYDDEHLPEGRTLIKKHLQDYLKRLRFYCGKVRFFACGEYGEKYSRPHYHLIVFGIDKDNHIFAGKKYDAKSGIFYVKSPVWKNGTTYIGDVSYKSCRYVASYVNKKVFGKFAKDHYEKLGIIPEFTLMSRKPGIGTDFVNFTEPNLFGDQFLFTKEKRWVYPVSMKIKSLIRINLRRCEKLRSLHTQEKYQKMMSDSYRGMQTTKQNLHSRREALSKLSKILKQLIYWLTVVMPVIDGIKTTCKCISAGIEAGKADIQKEKDNAEAQLFIDINRDQTDSPLDDLFKDMK